jgi:hypothetical protein
MLIPVLNGKYSSNTDTAAFQHRKCHEPNMDFQRVEGAKDEKRSSGLVVLPQGWDCHACQSTSIPALTNLPLHHC